jgi:hypothetical protein
MADTLRHFFFEYFGRMAKDGPRSLPSSFNVLEGFLEYSKRYVAFDVREEREHLLRLYEYFNWFTAETSPLPADPGMLQDVMQEGVIYSYDTIGATDDFNLRAGNSDIAILGVSLVRHEGELSAMLLAGEHPPYRADEEVGDRAPNWISFPGREALKPAPEYTIASRYVPGLPGYGRVILLTRIDLRARKYDVRYIHLDTGPGYEVITDDLTVLRAMGKPFKGLLDEMGLSPGVLDMMKLRLARYDDLFSAVTALIYLPTFFLTRPPDVVETRFVTELFVRRGEAKVKKAVRALGYKSVPFYRTIRCLASDVPSHEPRSHAVAPPELQFASSGYWQTLDPGEIGEDQSGNPVPGKTYVERLESWSARRPESFLVRKRASVVEGPDPGFVYVMRSASHERDVHKIGLARKSAEGRADELSQATGVPLPFGVLAQWEVGNCSGAEAEIHLRLARYRLNKRREFFRVSLSAIVATIEQVVRAQLT